MYDLGLDIGGSTVKLGVFDEEGRLFRILKAKTPNDPDGVVKVVAEMIQGIDYDHVGIATAGTVDRKKKALSDLGGNISRWRGFPLGEALMKKGIHLDVLENDINCALIGEMTDREDDDVLYVGIGTGIGGAFYTGGHLFLGSRGSAMEIGHLIVRPEGEVCSCGQRGCAEVYYSAKAFYRQMKGAGYEEGDRFLASGLEEAKAYVEGLADYFIGLESVLNPSVILIGGGMITYAPSIVKKLHAAMIARGNENIRAPLEPARLGNNGGMIGACKLAKIERSACANHP